MLLDLPDALSSKILEQWLSLPQIAKLDSAFCNKLCRAAFHLLATGTSSVYDYNLPIRIHDGSMQRLQYHCWLLLRQVAVSSFMLPNTEDDLYILYFEKFGAAIENMMLIGSAEGNSSDFALGLTAKHCPGLKCLTLLACNLKNGIAFEKLFQGCPQIKSLTIESGKSDGIHEFAYIGLADNCSNLTFLNLTGSDISHTDLSALLERCPDITIFELAECTKCADFILPSACKKLTTFLANSVLIGDTTLVTIARNNPLLTVLAVDSCDFVQITDATVYAAAECCPLLEEIHLCECPRITDGAVATLVRACRHLRRLYLNDSDNISDDTLIAIGAYCKQFNCLQILGCEMVTDKGLIALHNGCKELECVELDLNVCLEVTPAVIELYGEKLIHLGTQASSVADGDSDGDNDDAVLALEGSEDDGSDGSDGAELEEEYVDW